MERTPETCQWGEEIVTKPRLLDLPHGYQTLVDEDDMERIGKLTLYRSSNGYVYYSKWHDGKSWPELLHRLLVNAPEDRSFHVDHINGDKLDNRRENLRVVTAQKNQINRKRLNRNNSSGVRGVAFSETLGKWRAQITFQKKNHHLGLFQTKDEAVSARRAAEMELYGELCP